jgi:hypothetical protein
MTTGQAILEAIRKRLRAHRRKPVILEPSPLPRVDNLHLLNTLNLGLKVSKDDYKAEIEKYQRRLNLLTRDPKFKDRSVILLFEGNDAAGKGGVIRRVTGALDAPIYHIVPVAAPTDEEQVQPYLWRFWRQIPRRGKFAIFDRSWYGGLSSESRVSPADWLRAYSEISDFEEMTRHKILWPSSVAISLRNNCDDSRSVRPPVQTLQADAGRLAQSKEVDDYVRASMRHGGPDKQRLRAMDSRGGQRQMPCPDQSAPDNL